MENIWVRDNEDLLTGNLLAPMRLDTHYDEVDEDYTGEVFLQERGHRVVFISGGTMNRSYGGPEEGGWYYDHFDTNIEFSVTVYDVETLRQVISHIEALLRLRYSDIDVRDLQIIVKTGDFFCQRRPHYE